MYQKHMTFMYFQIEACLQKGQVLAGKAPEYSRVQYIPKLFTRKAYGKKYILYNRIKVLNALAVDVGGAGSLPEGIPPTQPATSRPQINDL